MRDQNTGNGTKRSSGQQKSAGDGRVTGRVAGGTPTIQTLESRVLMTTSTASLSAAADSYVRDGTYAARNLGGEVSIGVLKSGAGFNRQGYVKFDLTKVQGSVDKAVLRLYGRFTTTGTVAMPVAVQGVADFSWGERTITWSNRPAAGEQLGTALFGTAYKWVDVDVTPYVALAKAGGAAAVSFALAGAQTGPAQVLVNAKESG
ncbi:MAG TPA: DNRLRE domain-containing protein, partial [Humisphaera sp.]